MIAEPRDALLAWPDLRRLGALSARGAAASLSGMGRDAHGRVVPALSDAGRTHDRRDRRLPRRRFAEHAVHEFAARLERCIARHPSDWQGWFYTDTISREARSS